MVNHYERLQEFLAGRDKVIINPAQPDDWDEVIRDDVWHHHVQVTQWENSITILRMSKTWISHIHAHKYVAVPSYDAVRICQNGKLFFTIKGKKSFSLDKNTQMFASVAHTLNECLNKYLIDFPTAHEIAIANNPRLADLSKYLPSEQAAGMFILSSYVRSRIYKAYDKNGTGAAYKAILGVSNKPLLALAWNNPAIVQHLRCMLKKGIAADHIAHQLGKIHSWKLEACITLAEIYPLAKAAKLFNKTVIGTPPSGYVFDLVEQYKQLQQMGVTVPLSFNVKRDHDLVALELNRRARAAESLTHLPVYPEMEHKEGVWSFESPKLGVELLDAGMNLNICVGGYIDRVVAKTNKVIIIRKDGKDFGCLDVFNGRLTQAKLSHNQRVVTHPELLALVLAWAERLGLTLDTRDVTTPPSQSYRTDNEIEEGFPW